MNKLNIFEIVRKYFPEKEYALMQEVRNAAGFGASRSADYMAMNLWPSRGLSLHGIEQKSFRSDWTKELKSPEKADEIFKYCDYWWLLTTNDGVAKMDEIPEMWGWLHIANGKIKILKDAPKLAPCSMDRSFLACILKRAASKDGFIRADSIAERLEVAKLEGENSKNYKLSQMEERLSVLQKQFSEFRQYTGIDIGQVDSWRQTNMEKVGNAVNLITKGGIDHLVDQILQIESTAERLLTGIKNNIANLKPPVTQ
ncbi:hypothetical protein [Pedobacter sp. B4-66]|uniref:hypothetical protein n=1 Tax=Pedobacter sp. B4-66 TaxID=2817280 RepID=UPI001BD9E9C0|nr:hypothetical protein [Pedobacter sp. B4-66]